MKKFILILLLYSSYFSLEAHNPLTSRVELVSSSNNKAVLNIYMTQSGLQKALLNEHNAIDFKELSRDQYEKLIIDYLKSRIKLSVNNNLLELGLSAVKLGSHETDAFFYIKNYPINTESLKVDIDAFKENGNQQTVFWWRSPKKNEKVVLSKKNDFKKDFGIKNNSPFLKNQYLLIFGILVISTIGFILFIKRKQLLTNGI
ncbi:hypothetical protein [Polaribacter sp. Asnod6-C07]|uniref:hypothetical protein n=1 Tax=Polaribacter sp. Asnod6-C07 TaxID=3160582 RepID=UPI003867170E